MAASGEKVECDFSNNSAGQSDAQHSNDTTTTTGTAVSMQDSVTTSGIGKTVMMNPTAASGSTEADPEVADKAEIRLIPTNEKPSSEDIVSHGHPLRERELGESSVVSENSCVDLQEESPGKVV